MPLKPRGYIFIFIIFLLSIIAIAAITGGGGKNSGSISQQRPDPNLQFTIHSDTIGMDNVTIINESTGARITITQTMMPFTANFAKNDILTFRVSPRIGYVFNAWFVNDRTWESNNPLTMRPPNSFTMKAYFIGGSGGTTFE